MKKLTEALLLKGLWKIKPIPVVLFLLFMAYQAWMGNPYFMYYVVGAPEPGTAPRYVGKLKHSRLDRRRFKRIRKQRSDDMGSRRFGKRDGDSFGCGFT